MPGTLFSIDSIRQVYNTAATPEGAEIRSKMNERAEMTCRKDPALGSVLRSCGLTFSQAALVIAQGDVLKVLRYLKNPPVTVILDDNASRILQIVVDRVQMTQARNQSRNLSAERAMALLALQESLLNIALNRTTQNEQVQSLYFIDTMQNRQALRRLVASAGAVGISRMLGGVRSGVIIKDEYGLAQMIDDTESRVTRFLTASEQKTIMRCFDGGLENRYDEAENRTLIPMVASGRTIGLIWVRGNESLFEEGDRTWLSVAAAAVKQALFWAED